MNFNLIILLALALAIAHLTWADETRIIRNDDGERAQNSVLPSELKKQKDGQAKGDSGDKAEIVRQFFEFQGISADIDEDMLARYQPEVVKRMAAMLEKKADFVAVYRLNIEVNSLIFELLEKEASKSIDLWSKLKTELRVLQLMVPDSEAMPELQLAKEDLGKFCVEQPKHCDELLERVKQRLERKEFHTHDALSFLEGFYHNWVPLGRLSKFIEDFGSSEKQPLDRL